VKKLFEGLYLCHREEKRQNASTGPNKFSKQCHYAPELPVEATVFATFGMENMVMTAGARRCTGGLPVLLQQLVAFHLPQTTL